MNTSQTAIDPTIKEAMGCFQVFNQSNITNFAHKLGFMPGKYQYE
jgi:hypothetical protein